MTRKEPQFNDDPDTPVSVPDPVYSVRPETEPAIPHPMKSQKPIQAGSNWLLWLFVVVSLCLSFGMAFFGLEEAGHYQAALTKAENQAKTLEETIERLNRLQTQGIGELAQSDAQMRQMMSSVQTKLAEDVEKKFSNVSKRFDALSADLARTGQANEDMTKKMANLATNIDGLLEVTDSLQGQVSTERSRLDKAAQSIEGIGSQLSTERSRLDKAAQTIDGIGSQLQLVTNETAQLNERLQSGERKLDETAKLAEQALDDKTATIAIEVLAEEVLGYKQLLEDLRNDLLTQQDSNLALVSQLDDLRVQVAGVKELEPQIAKLSKLIGELDVGRKQITQRIIDLDARWNDFSRLERTVLDSQKRIQKIDSQLNENAESLGKLRSKIDDYADQAVIAR
jgi:chromosome segregation ATPase